MSIEQETKPHRRKEFDALTTGWGGDCFEDLMARCQLLAEWWKGNFPLTMAEMKVARAMIDRLRRMGGLPQRELPH